MNNSICTIIDNNGHCIATTQSLFDALHFLIKVKKISEWSNVKTISSNELINMTSLNNVVNNLVLNNNNIIYTVGGQYYIIVDYST